MPNSLFLSCVWEILKSHKKFRGRDNAETDMHMISIVPNIRVFIIGWQCFSNYLITQEVKYLAFEIYEAY